MLKDEDYEGQIICSRCAKMQQFYVDLLGFALLERTADHFTIAMGKAG